MYKLGIDIGASHIGLGLYDTTKKKLTKKKYIPYKPHAKALGKVSLGILTKKYVSLLIKKIDSFLDDNKIDYIVVCMKEVYHSTYKDWGCYYIL